ncbi:hypothetical protein BO85DRAFT_187840 [Aspergillus piperis CBS 112811]|uniref:Uncharacterized protein n=1 Tax=Aspergillus piperis CBS 112811 TaxID=1448313 RepID=A0A8G1R7T2_9EURO|nr:hypothetical protein BO85DRAFT_187840 [Aspergillus piperis CBS 112811]RAH61104.1 hypothetical protein BO85DRAFT_187840 [Aspergillus piperis CBS 112811]
MYYFILCSVALILIIILVLDSPYFFAVPCFCLLNIVMMLIGSEDCPFCSPALYSAHAHSGVPSFYGTDRWQVWVASKLATFANIFLMCLTYYFEIPL